MDLQTYTQHAIATAEPRAYDLEYLLPGLVSEVGELLGEFAKQHWHGADRSVQIADEYGDCAWLAAVLCHRSRVTDVSEVTNLRYTDDKDGALELLLARATSCYRSGADILPARAAAMWVTLADHAAVVTGQSWAEVLAGNVAKLQARAAKGELRTHA